MHNYFRKRINNLEINRQYSLNLQFEMLEDIHDKTESGDKILPTHNPAPL